MIDSKTLQNIENYHREMGADEQRVKNISNYAKMNVSLETEEDTELKLFSTTLKFTPIGKDEICIMHKSNSLEKNLRAIINLLIANGYSESTK